MSNLEIDKAAVVTVLNKILETELAGVVRYTHYAFMIYGFGRIPIVAWMRSQASESLTHADQAGELITYLGSHPSLGIGPLLETHRHDAGS
jgi:bacterioferritin